MNPFDAASPDELCEKLRQRDVRVPGRTRGRTTGHSEIWVTCRFLATIAASDLLRYPMRVEPGDRPDLVLSLPSGRMGIEISEAISEDQARVDALSELEDATEFRPVPCYRPGEPRRSLDEIKALALGRKRVLPRMGDSVERDWVDAMLHVAERKAGRFTRPGFATHDENWLLLYDNWEPEVDEPVATPRLHRQLFTRDWTNPFDKVFILRPRNLWQFSKGADFVKHVIPHAWQASPIPNP